MSSISRQNILPTKKKHGNSSWPNQALQKEPKFTRASEVQTQRSVAHAPREQASVALIRSQALPGPAHRTSAPAASLHHAPPPRRSPTASLHLLCRRHPPSLLHAAQMVAQFEETAYRRRVSSSPPHNQTTTGALPLDALAMIPRSPLLIPQRCQCSLLELFSVTNSGMEFWLQATTSAAASAGTPVKLQLSMRTWSWFMTHERQR